ncbi:sigma-70 family RNA polymerase sigma factor [Planctomyces sp. SH-PL14]|uniref:sigma-70 family RNA polymerase sigma factor n=1 Tax=Planctomyces sp. SH-PL14 TaxID=1632864 RepID=UPI00078B22E3|nr:sigma-70 family RNA polymerase sigma factor [Planctomyces sp. SH-PL14]AMV21983.1 RNA polymerase sigma factor SigA [Planctomyces sp. SH-PL14]
MSQYKNPAIRQLTDQQVRYAPIDVRVEQMDRAEQFLTEIDPSQSYRYQDVCERVTSFRPAAYPQLEIEGGDLAHDLQLFVEDLSTSANLAVETMPEPVLTVEDVSKKYNVSTKTVDRWRKRGLVSRRFRFGNRTRVGFLTSSLTRFVNEHHDEIDRGSRFTQLSETEREDIILHARKLARSGTCLTEISKRLSKSFERSPETIRYTLKQYDADHPENAVFPDASEPLGADRKKEIYQRYKRGTAIDVLAGEYCRSKSSIQRIVSEVRAELIFEQPIDFMDSPEFHVPAAEVVILGAPPVVDKKGPKVKAPPGLPPYLASLYTVPLLTREEEGYYFRKMNFLKFQAHELREQIDRSRPRASELDRLESLVEQAGEVKNFLIRSNLRLVVSIAKRHMTPTTSFFEMVSDGNMSLIRAIEKFDYTKGNKFSTYATWAIMKNYARSIPAHYTQMDRFRTGNEEVFEFSREKRGSQFLDEQVNQGQHKILMGILDQLDERERAIIVNRYGLDVGSDPLTLEEVGNRFGVTKERIRQIETRALQKMRKILADEPVDIPGV